MRYRHENGYSAELYGKSSMIIFRPDGTERLHTGSRNVNTKSEVMELLEMQPESDRMFSEAFNDIMNDTEDADI